MTSHLASKYLNVPEDCGDFGKPSPLAMLAATCKKIGVESPRVARRRVLRTPSPQPTTSRTPSPQHAATSLFETPVPEMACHQLPPTPPPSPPPCGTGTLKCHQPSDAAYQPSSTPRYTPYTIALPTRTQYVPAVDYMNSYCYSPFYMPRRVSYLPYHPESATSQISSSFVFGVYPQHIAVGSSTSSSLKVRSKRGRRTHGHIANHSGLGFGDEIRVEEEIIDVVSL